VASENYRQDIRISDEILTRMQDAYRRLRNTIRYMLGNLGDFGPENVVRHDSLEVADRWALHRLELLREKVLAAYKTFDFHVVYHSLHNFCAVDMSSFYLDICKDRLYTYAKDAKERRAAQTVLAQVLADFLKLASPILVFTAEESWACLPSHLREVASVHLADFPPARPENVLAESLAAEWDELLRVRSVVSRTLEEKRREGAIGSSLEARLALRPGDERVEAVLRAHVEQLPWVFIVSQCDILPVEAEAGSTEDRLIVEVSKASGEKCVRCWNYRESVGSVADQPKLCRRCVDQLGGLSE
jgi:isoleucyl-tRNA synthetase